METPKKAPKEKVKKSNSMKADTSTSLVENLTEEVKLERSRLLSAIGEFYSRVCFNAKYGFNYSVSEEAFNMLNHIDAEGLENKLRGSYKRGTIKKLKLKLSEDQVKDVIKKSAARFCRIRDERMEDGSWNNYISYSGAKYSAKKKKLPDAIDDFLDMEQDIEDRSIAPE